MDLPQHLAGPDGVTRGGQLSGTHNLDNAVAALAAKGASYQSTPTGTSGILELRYSYKDTASGQLVNGRKTVYDPQVISDDAMLRAAAEAGEIGWQQFLRRSSSSKSSVDVAHAGINFRVYIKQDANGIPFIGNVHPIK